ncbi:MAG: hypothetical protein LBB45_06925 [Methanobrevibacter sp.]|jgi:hypothetical protein|nr:hypothetical protein [Candidatus Methanovirga basalitermitum]
MNRFFPVLNEKYALHKGANVSFIYNFSTKDKRLINKDAALIIDECDGLNSFDQVIKNLSEKTGEKSEELNKNLKNFILNSEYFKILNKPSHRNLLSTGSWDFQIPIYVSIELTHHCNFHCKYCYNESSKLQNNHTNKK